MNLSKNEQLSILRLLLGTQDIFHKCEIYLAIDNSIRLNDKERYLKMAIRIDPTDSGILTRKKEYKLLPKFESKVRVYHLLQ